MKYNPAIVSAFYVQQGLPVPQFEFRFAPPRKWRFDIAWLIPSQDIFLALEVQGGIWTRGRHNRGAAMLKEWEKLNTAAALGWRILYVPPQDVCLTATVRLIKDAMGI